MEKSGRVAVSAPLLRARVEELAARFADRLEETADDVRARTSDRAVRRRALAFKVEAVPAVYSAAYHADPLTAVVDVWALSFQVAQYVDQGTGRNAFGSGQDQVREVTRDLIAETDAVVRGIVRRPEDFDQVRATVEGWAKQHPVRHTLLARPPMIEFAARLRTEQQDAFGAVGAATETLETVSERLNRYAAGLPKLARWQAELLVSEQAEEHDVEAALRDVGALGDAARRANRLMDGVAESPVRELLADERRGVLDAVDRQRLQTLQYMTAERVALVGALREERLATLATLRQERVESLQEVDAIKTRAVASAVAGMKELVDYALWRLAALLLLFMLLAAPLALFGYRLAARRPGPTPS
jgi:hypothetical protein